MPRSISGSAHQSTPTNATMPKTTELDAYIHLSDRIKDNERQIREIADRVAGIEVLVKRLFEAAAGVHSVQDMFDLWFEITGGNDGIED